MSSRKRLKRSTDDDSDSASKGSDLAQSSSKQSPETLAVQSGPSSKPDIRSPEKIVSDKSEENTQQIPPQNRPWNVGTWPRISKSIPSTQVATESILATVGKPLKSKQSRLLADFSQPRDSSSNSKASSLRNEPISGTGQDSENTNISGQASKQPSESKTQDITIASVPETSASNSVQVENSKSEQSSVPQNIQATDISAWLGWFSGSKPEAGASESTPKGEGPSIMAKDAMNETPDMKDGRGQNTTKDPAKDAEGLDSTPQQPKAWLGFWGSANTTPRPSTPMQSSTLGTTSPARLPGQPEIQINQGDLKLDEAPSDSQGTISPTGVRTSGWAFWSRDPANATKTPEIKVRNDTSIPTSSIQQDPTTPSKPGVPNLGKRSRPLSLDTSDGNSDRAQDSLAKLQVQSKDSNLTQMVTDMRRVPPNLVLPSLKNTYQLLENASILEQLARLLHLGKSYPIKHVNISREPLRIKKALAIGVHGYFPAPLLRTVLGQPTGTSIRFASSAAEAIERFTNTQGYTCEIEKVALEGEGRIAERIETLWKLMLNWIDHIKNADFIIVACHSQGVPVAMMLIAKLIEFGCVSSARIGVCAMAGVNLGPFPDYKSRLFSSGTAGELFEFSNPKSLVSQRYEDALRVALGHGVRIVYVGSIDDQLVSLESSTFSTISHPYVYRAVFIDGRVHAPDFITHLVGFALKLRNLGISDHGMIRELSSPLAGSLYTGEGHSRIYNEGAVYDLAIEHALMTTSVGDVPLQVAERQASPTANPYILPWSMRGLLEEDYVKSELGKETQNLLEQFDEWKPTSKVLKDVKFRLEAVKSKL